MSKLNARLRQIADQLNPKNIARETVSRLGNEAGNFDSVLGLLDYISSPMGSLTAKKFGQKGGKGGARKTSSSRRKGAGGSGGGNNGGNGTSSTGGFGDNGISAIITELRNIRTEIVILQDIVAKQASLTKFQVNQIRKQTELQKENMKVRRQESKKDDFKEQVKRHRDGKDEGFNMQYSVDTETKEKGMIENILSFMGLRALGATILGGITGGLGMAAGIASLYGKGILRIGIVGVIISGILGGIQAGWKEYAESGDLAQAARKVVEGTGSALWSMISDTLKWFIGLLPEKYKEFGHNTLDSITNFLVKTHEVIEGMFGELFADFTSAAAGMVAVGVAIRAILRPISTLKLVFSGMKTALRSIASGIGAATRGVGAANRAIQRATNNLRTQTAARAGSSRPTITAGNGAPRQSGTRPQSTIPNGPRSAGPSGRGVGAWFDKIRAGARNVNWGNVAKGTAGRGLGALGYLITSDISDDQDGRYHRNNEYNLNTLANGATAESMQRSRILEGARILPPFSRHTRGQFEDRMPFSSNAWSQGSNDQSSLQRTFNNVLSEDNIQTVFENLSKIRSIAGVGRELGIGDLAINGMQNRVSDRIRSSTSGLPNIDHMMNSNQGAPASNGRSAGFLSRHVTSMKWGANPSSSIVDRVLENSYNAVRETQEALERNFGDYYGNIRSLNDMLLDNRGERGRLNPNSPDLNSINPVRVDITEGIPMSSIKNPATRSDFVANSMSRGQRQLNQMAALASNPMSAGQGSNGANVVNNKTTVNNNQYNSATPSTRQSNPLSGSNIVLSG